MITKYLLFEDVSGIIEAREEFERFNPQLDVTLWDFEIVSQNKVVAEPQNGKSFFVMSPCHFGWWV